MIDQQPLFPYDRMVEVTWTDSCSTRSWTDHDAFAGYSPAVCRTVGYLVAEKDHCLIVAGSQNKHQVDGVMCIPKSAIRDRRDLGGVVEHASSCAVHNEPAYPAGPCDCGADALEREGWTRFRAYDRAADQFTPWPAGEEREILVYDGCNGFMLWHRTDRHQPIGTHWKRIRAPKEAADEHAAHIASLRRDLPA
jgi:hypothetical protein